jgi:DNA-binding transcriptional LysR family regulator
VKVVGKKLDCDDQIGRRIRLRDLHVFLTVGQRGSMAGAAAQLGVSQPAVSAVIADLERTLGVPLFERSTRGVKPTVYARAMIDRSVAAFDELKQGIRTLENLSDPASGELWIGCIESVSVLALPSILDRFMERNPRVVVHVERLSSPSPAYRELTDRNLDLALGRMPADAKGAEELVVEPLLRDKLLILAGAQTRWARCRSIELEELADEPWVLTRPDCWTYSAVNEAFRARDLDMPHVSLTAQSVPLRLSLAATGRYLTAVAGTERSLGAYRLPVKVLPIDMPNWLSPLSIVTVKDRVLNPIALSFIDHLRGYGEPECVAVGQA